MSVVQKTEVALTEASFLGENLSVEKIEGVQYVCYMDVEPGSFDRNYFSTVKL